MSVIAPVSGLAEQPTSTLYTAGVYPVSLNIRIVNLSSSPANYLLSVGSLGLRVALQAVQPGQHLDIETGLKLPAGTVIQHESSTGGAINAMVTGVQDDGQ